MASLINACFPWRRLHHPLPPVVGVAAVRRSWPQGHHRITKYGQHASFNVSHGRQSGIAPPFQIRLATSQHGSFTSPSPTLSRAASSERSHSGSSIRAVPVQVAHELLNAGHRYLDVRTAEEFASGHIEGAVNIPYMYKVGPGLTKNVKFLEDVGEKFGKDDEIVVGCQMGKRSQMAAEELVAAGYTGITDMAGGFLAWMQSGMPTEASV